MLLEYQSVVLRKVLAMKSPSVNRQCNLKGKKFSLMTCRCCYMFNFKDKIRNIEDTKRIRDAMKCIEE